MRRFFASLIGRSIDGLVGMRDKRDAPAKYLSSTAKIEGWGLNFEIAPTLLLLDAEQYRLGVTGTLFEIGVHHGQTAILLALLARRGEQCVFLDLFDQQEENVDNSGRGDLRIFKENLAKWAPGVAAEIVVGNSLKVDFASIPALAAGIRFAHIDGGHLRDVVLNDLYKTEALLAPGGLIVIDDFMHSGFLGVNEACNQYLAEARDERLSAIAAGKNKLVLADRVHADRYKAALRSTLKPPFGKTVEFYEHSVVCLDAH